MASSYNRSKSRTTRNRFQYEALEPKRLLAANPIISEFVASNTSTFDDGYGDSSDWIELTNTGDTPVDLAGYHLTDNAVDPTKWTFSQSTILQPGDHLVIFASARDEVDPLGFQHTNFKLSSGGEYIGLSDADGNLLSQIGSISQDYPPQVTDISYGQTGGSLINGQSVAEYLVPTSADSNLGTTWTANGFDAASAGFDTGRASIGYENSPSSSVNFAGLFETEVPSGTTSVYLRSEFEVEDASQINDLTLSLMYDDGFAAYLNGTFLFSRNAGNGLAWNATASSTHSDTDAIEPASFKLDGSAGAEGDFLSLLVDGTNTLAIHALNRPNSSDMLLVPTLVSNSVGGSASYLSTPTPGEQNAAPIVLGPQVEDVTPNGTVATAGQDLIITADISQFDLPVNQFSARLHYQIMFDGEVTVNMNDGGLGNDAVAGDGIYTATIPGSALSAGELLRWAVSVRDVDDNETRAPRFLDPLNSAEYFGTVVTDPSVDTDLPVLQWFVENPNAAFTDAGARGSLFFNGQFYDNINTDAHGQSTRLPEFAKKSFDFDANSGDKFLIAEGYSASDFNLLTNYADQTKIRHPLAYDLHTQAGIEAHLAFSVTVYQNGEYYGLFDLVEEGDEEYLERVGLDPNGALYKVNNPLTSAFNEVDKETRNYENHDDLQNVINANSFSGTSAATWRFDNLDIAKTVNYLAVHNLISNQDFGHKNMYWYRDTEGTGLWFPLPWDQDLSFGHRWNGNIDPPYFDNNLITNDSLTGGLNNLFQQMLADPTIREMYNRRLRTLSDQFYGAPGTPISESYLYQKATELEALVSDEAADDQAEWGLQFRYAAAYPFNPSQAVDQLKDVFLLSQRNHIVNQSFIPNAQASNPSITFDDNDFDASPVSGLQSEEYIRLRNNNNTAIDISGWQLTGGIEHTFHSGTVIPAGESLYVVADVVAFQNRSTGPNDGQRLFIQGNYKGQLSSNGETVNLISTDGTAIDTLVTPNEGPSDNQQFLRITEFSYNPTDAAGDAEYIEFTNISSGQNATTLDLSGVTISEGPSTPFVFTDGTLLPAGFRLVVVKDAGAFSAQFPSTSPFAIAGTYTGSLSNSGETIRVDDAGGERILEFTYNDSDPWSPAADGAGGALQLVDEANTPVDLLDKYYSWRSTYREGTPAEAPDSANANIVISEVLAHTDLPQTDFIELHNPGSSAIDVGGWYLSDSRSDLQKFQIPAATVIPAGGYVVFDENDFNPTPLTPGVNDFALSSEGDDVWLTTTIGGETAFIDSAVFGATFNGESVGPVPVANGRLSPLLNPTPGAANSSERVGPVLITEVHYHPADPSGSTLAIDPLISSSDLEFIEIHNSTSGSIPLLDWRVRGEVDYDFDSISIAAGATILVVSFDPSAAENSNLLAAFRDHHGIGTGVQLVGGFAGSLSNSFGRVELQQPDTPDPTDPTNIPHVTSDEVLYDDLAPWADADGNGNSLQRIAGNVTGNLSTNWNADAPSPGTVSLIAAAPELASMQRDEGGVLARPDLIETLSFTFDTDVNIAANALTLSNLTTGGTAVDLSQVSFSYVTSTRTATWDFGGLATPIPASYYEATISANQVSGVGSNLNLANDIISEIYVALRGDANLDGRVDVLGDAFTLVSNLGSTTSTAWADGNFNGDGVVDVLGDAFVLVSQLGQSVIPPLAVSLASRTPVTIQDSFATDESSKTDAVQHAPATEADSEFQLAGSQTLDEAFASEDWLI